MSSRPRSGEDPSLVRWPAPGKAAGLACGWEGYAWTAAHLVGSGTMHAIPGLEAKVRRFALEELAAPAPKAASHLWGAGGVAVVCGRYASFDGSLRPLVRQSFRRWQATWASCPSFDLAEGTAGALLACAELDRIGCGTPFAKSLKPLQETCARALHTELESAEAGRASLGLLHGIAGLLLALVVGRAVLGLPVRRSLTDRAFEALCRHRFRTRRGLTQWFGWTGVRRSRRGSWCSGAPGITAALLRCAEWTGEERYLRLAVEGALSTRFYRTVARCFCCGTVGRSQVLIETYRVTGDTPWLDYALALRRLRGLEASPCFSLPGFFWGRLGLDYLDHRIRNPALPLPGLGPQP